MIGTIIVPTTIDIADEKVVMTMTIMKDHTKKDMGLITTIIKRNIPAEATKKRISRKISTKRTHSQIMKASVKNHILAGVTRKRVITKGEDSIKTIGIPL